MHGWAGGRSALRCWLVRFERVLWFVGRHCEGGCPAASHIGLCPPLQVMPASTMFGNGSAHLTPTPPPPSKSCPHTAQGPLTMAAPPKHSCSHTTQKGPLAMRHASRCPSDAAPRNRWLIGQPAMGSAAHTHHAWALQTYMSVGLGGYLCNEHRPQVDPPGAR